MNAKKHIELLGYSFLTWLTFYIIGLPEYYQQWYLWAKVTILVLVTAMYFPITQYTLNKYWTDGKHLINSSWLALYLTLPLFVYDYLLLAWYKELGIGFVIPYWYLTFFYFSFWLQFPAVGWWMERRQLRMAEKQSEQRSNVPKLGALPDVFPSEVLPVKDEDEQQPIPTAWRPVFRDIVSAFVRHDYRLTNGVEGVVPVSAEAAKQIEEYLGDYGETLVTLPEETWASSICIWTGKSWEVLIDLWTESEGHSDLVLSALVSETKDGFQIEIEMVYVP